LQKLLLPLTLCSYNIPAKNSKSCSFSILLNHKNMILDGSKNSWMVMSTTTQFCWTVMGTTPQFVLDGNENYHPGISTTIKIIQKA